MRRTEVGRWISAAVLLLAAAGLGHGKEERGQLRDAFGFTLPPGPAPQRIVSLSPNLTEILFAIGTNPERIVGVTRFCDFPPEAKGRNQIGGIVDPSIEGIVALKPDLILATRGNPARILGQLRGTGLPLFAFDSQDGLDRVLQTIREMVEIVSPDMRTKADSTVARFAARLHRFQTIARTVEERERPTVYYYDPISPDWTSGPGTHISEAIWLAGGRNVADDASTAWPRYALEVVVSKQPDRLLIAVPADADPDQILADLQARNGWRALDAVREKRFCLIPADQLLRPGPRTLDAIGALGHCLHPDQDWEIER